MDVMQLVGLFWRQRLVVIPAIVLSIASLAAAYVVAPTTYRASGSIVLIPPPPEPETPIGADPATTPTTVQSYNPYVSFRDPSVVVEILTRILRTESIQRALDAEYPGATFEVGANTAFYRGPIIDVAANAATPNDAMAAVEVVMKECDRVLLDRQVAQGTDPK